MDNLFLWTKHLVFLQAGAPAGGAGGAGQGDWGEVLARMFPMLVILIVFMYLFAIRPQRKQEQEKRSMLDSVKKNDRVVTIGGLHGTVSAIKSETITLTVAENVQLKLNKGAIQRILKKGSREEDED